jgi:hypothetical protein
MSMICYLVLQYTPQILHFEIIVLGAGPLAIPLQSLGHALATIMGWNNGKMTRRCNYGRRD